MEALFLREQHPPSPYSITVPAVLFRVGRAHPEGLFEKKEKLPPNSVQNVCFSIGQRKQARKVTRFFRLARRTICEWTTCVPI